MRKYVALFILMLASFNVSAQFKWPIFSNKDDPKHCPLSQLNYEDDLEKKHIIYNEEDIIFTIKNYTKSGLGYCTKNSNTILMQAYDPKTMIHERVLNNKAVYFETTEYELRTGGGYLYSNIIIERKLPNTNEDVDDEIL